MKGDIRGLHNDYAESSNFFLTIGHEREWNNTTLRLNWIIENIEKRLGLQRRRERMRGFYKD